MTGVPLRSILPGTLITSSNYAMVAEQLRRDCIAAKNPSPADERFCELVDSCFESWQKQYNPNKESPESSNYCNEEDTSCVL